MLNRRNKCTGFTLVELLVALMILSIVLSAAVTMAGALSGAKTANDQMNRDIASLLQVQTRLSDLIMRANAVTLCEAGRLVVWHDRDADGVAAADNSEYTTIETDGISLILYQNNALADKEIYSNCRLMNIYGDSPVPDTKWVMIQFDMTQYGITETYSVSGTLRARN